MKFTAVVALAFCFLSGTLAWSQDQSQIVLSWESLFELPDPLGVAGPVVGVHNESLIVAGGANFPKPVWEASKVWHKKIYVLRQGNHEAIWRKAGELESPLGYPACGVHRGGRDCHGRKRQHEHL